MDNGGNNLVALALDEAGCATAEKLSSQRRILLMDCSDSSVFRAVRYERGQASVVESRASSGLTQAETAVAAFLEKTPGCDTLIVLAGTSPLDDWLRRVAAFEQSFAREFFLPLVAVKAVLPRMMAQKAGRIIVALPKSGLLADSRSAPATCAHWALRRVCQSLRAEMGAHGISVHLAFSHERRPNGMNGTFDGHGPEELAADLAHMLAASGNEGATMVRRGDRLLYAKRQLFPLGSASDGNGHHAEPGKPRTTVITGASSGLGRELARRCAPHVDILQLVGRNMQALEELRRELARVRSCEVHLAGVDLADPLATADFAKRLECTDTLINCAGFSVVGRITDVPLDLFRKNMAVNFLGPVVLTCAALAQPTVPRRIVNILSTTAVAGRKRHGSYSATKAALWAFTQMLRDVVPAGVQVVEAIPATFASDFARNTVAIATGPGKPRAEQSARGTRHGVTSAMVAEKISNAMRRGNRRVYVPFNARLFLSLEAVAPSLFRRLFK